MLFAFREDPIMFPERMKPPSTSGARADKAGPATSEMARRFLIRALSVGLALVPPVNATADDTARRLVLHARDEAYSALGEEDLAARKFRASLDREPKNQVSERGRGRLAQLSGNPVALRGAQPDLLPAGSAFRDCAHCPEMLVVPPGQFLMGSRPTETGRFEDESPAHRVTITKPFAVGKFEVTFEEWNACVEDGACAPLGNHGSGLKRHPVVNVSYEQAIGFTEWLSGRTGKKYRLLSEAEWEYAARAGTDEVGFWGNSPDRACQFANVYDETAKAAHSFGWENFPCDDGYANTGPVGSFEPNGFGLYDMLGNVWEWVDDCYNGSYAGAPTDGRVWRTGDCSRRVNRGGGWYGPPRFMRFAERDALPPLKSDDRVGFRVARTLP
jgi:formylglycine-generating enzyme required for sulfatase activity